MTILQLTLLGPFAVRRDDLLLTGFRSDKVRALLAYLAVEGDRPHARRSLAALFWPDHSADLALNNLSQTLKRLREAIGDAQADPPFLLATRQSVQWNPSSSTELDVVSFTRLGRSTVVADLEAAAALYSGSFLDGFYLEECQEFDEWLAIIREHLERLALEVLAALATTYLSTHAYGAAEAAARRQLVLDPWRETAHRQVMEALAGAGQRTAALAQFARLREVLEDDLGVEPDSETQALYARLLAGDLVQATHDRAPRHNLPVALAPCVGREAELRALTAFRQQEDVRLLTLVGVGGMGKTRLALEVAYASLDTYADGVYFVALAPLSAPDAVSSAIIRAIGVSVPGGDPTATLLRWIRDKHLLLILDNFEHLLDGVPQVVELLQAAPRLQIIATSREPLNVRGEHIYAVGGLEYGQGASPAVVESSSAIRLFVQVARRVLPGFRLRDADLPALLRICELVGGMPLGLELAASWVGVLQVEEIAREMTRDVDFLTADWSDAPDRHRSMRGVFDWSWRLLSPPEQHVLRQLSVFRGGFTREAAEAIAGGSLRVLASLHRKSLLQWRPGHGVAGRYEIHELVRQFAAEQLQAEPTEQAATVARHGVYYLRFVAARRRRLGRDEPREATAEIRAEIDNVRQAWNWGANERQVAALAQAAYGWWRFCEYSGLYLESLHTFGRAADCCRSVLETMRTHDPAILPMSGLSTLLAIHADLLFNNVPYEQMAAAAREAIGLGVASADIEGETVGTFVLGRALQELGRHAEAREMWEQTIELARAHRPRCPDSELLSEMEWMACIWLIGSATFFQDYQAARAWAGKCLSIAQSLGKRMAYVSSLSNVARIDLYIGNDAGLQERLEEVLSLSRTFEDRGLEVIVLQMLCDLLRMRGAYSDALPRLLAATEQARDVDDLYGEIYILAGQVRLACELGDLRNAARWRTELMDRVDRPGVTMDCQAAALRACALFALQSGIHEQAFAYAEHAVRLSAQADIPNRRAESILILGHVQAAMNEPHAAAEAYEEALSLYLRIGNLALASEPRAGLAQLAFTHGDLDTARTFVEALLPIHLGSPRAAVLTPYYIDLICYRVLAAAADSRATTMLQSAQQRLLASADQIPDLTLRASFLEKPEHYELLQLALA